MTKSLSQNGNSQVTITIPDDNNISAKDILLRRSPVLDLPTMVITNGFLIICIVGCIIGLKNIKKKQDNKNHTLAKTLLIIPLVLLSILMFCSLIYNILAFYNYIGIIIPFLH